MTGTLGDVPGLADYLAAANDQDVTNLSSSLGTLDASLTDLNGNLDLDGDPMGSGSLDGLTFGMTPFPEYDNELQANDPMKALHAPTLPDYSPITESYTEPVSPEVAEGLTASTEDADSAGVKAVGGGAFGKAAVRIARQYLGIPYVWGGTSPSGFDCSGLVQYVYKQLGISLPRLSADQARSGEVIPLSAARAGDLIAYDNSGRNYGADHIAIAIGNGMMIEAPHTGADVRVSKIYPGGWAVRLTHSEYDHQHEQAQATHHEKKYATQSAVTNAHAQAVRNQRGV